MFAPLDQGNSVDPETNAVINGDEQIQQERRRQTTPDKRDGKEIRQRRLAEIGPDPGDQRPVVLPGCLLEIDFAPLDPVEEFILFFLDFKIQFLLQFPDLFDQLL